jgi:hypothetical protein
MNTTLIYSGALPLNFLFNRTKKTNFWFKHMSPSFFFFFYMYLPHIIAILSVIYLIYHTKKRKNDKTLPPIAPGYVPVIGHLLSILNRPIHHVFSDWCQQVGPIYTCYFGSQTWIVLNSFEVIKDLIVDRGNIYSSRNLPDTLTEDFFQGGNDKKKLSKRSWSIFIN